MEKKEDNPEEKNIINENKINIKEENNLIDNNNA